MIAAEGGRARLKKKVPEYLPSLRYPSMHLSETLPQLRTLSGICEWIQVAVQLPSRQARIAAAAWRDQPTWFWQTREEQSHNVEIVLKTSDIVV